MTWVVDLVRLILGLLDRAIYGLIQLFYSTFIQIAQIEIFSETFFKNFAERVYTFLALIMIFKVTFSIINYIINPDNFRNNEKGVGKLIQNVVIVIALIVLVPWIFKEARSLERIIIEENVIGKIILGNAASVSSEDNAHKVMSYSVLRAFIKPNCKIKKLNDIPDLCGPNANYIPEVNEYQIIGDQISGTLDDMSSYTTSIYDEIANQYATVKVGQAFAYSEATNDYLGLINMVNAKYDINASREEKNQYIFSYTPIVSTIAGGFVAWIFMIFCFDIAVRSAKFAFLQLIAPVPIISYIDPKSGKSGMFSRWVKNCLSTYADLFIRIAAIYFALFVINNLNGVTFDGNFLVRVFVIVGVLMFAKQLPKLIEEISGIKLSGDFTLNPMKKLGASPFAAAALGGIGAGIGGFGANLANSIMMNKGQGVKGFMKGMGSTLAGTGSGMFRGGLAGLNGKANGNAWNAVTAGLKGSVDARNLRTKRVANGDGGPQGWLRRRGVDLQNAAGIESGASKFDRELQVYDDFLNEQQNLSSFLDNMIAKEKIGSNIIGDFDYTEEDPTSGQLITKRGSINVLKNRIDYLKANGGTAEQITRAENEYNAAKKEARHRAIDRRNDVDTTGKLIMGAGFKAEIDAAINQLNYIREQNASLDLFSNSDDKLRVDEIVTGENWDNAEGLTRGAITRVKVSTEYKQAQVNRKNDSNK